MGHDGTYYFALRPPAEAGLAAQAALRWIAGRRPLRRQTSLGRLHVSLVGVGSGPATDAVPAARRAAAAVRVRPFRVAFNRIGTWGRGDGVRPVVLWGDEGVIGVEWLHAALQAAVAPGRPRPIYPHMTLGRDPSALPERPVRPIGWWVDHFVLVRSGGGRTDLLGRWPLEG